MQDITKRFPGVVANDDIVFNVEKGEIHGLLGENGAGKSVLMSILYGLYKPDEGQILIDDVQCEMDSPATAMKHGIGMVHQHFMLVPSLTVLENIVLGKERIKNGFLLDYEGMHKEVKEFCEKYRLNVDLDAKIFQIPVGVQQRVEILKALYRGADVLILDEPTAVLTPNESEELFNAVRSLKKEGKTVIFISHKLREVLSICDRVTVLKRGQVVGTVNVADATEEKLTDMMVGRKIIYEFGRAETSTHHPVLRAEGLEALNDRDFPALRGLNLEVLSSEILGLAGVEGNGQTELIEALMGLRRLTAGKILLHEKDITGMSPDERIQLGVSHIPEDRYKRGMIRDFTIQENIILGSQPKSLKYLDDVKINIKIKLSVLWVTLMLFYIYADILGFYTPGVIEKVVSGEIGGIQITEIFLLAMAVWMAIPSVMVFLSLTLKANANRLLNIIAGFVSIITLGTTFFVGEFSARYTFQAIAEGMLIVWIVWHAWKWPKRDA